MDTDAYKAEMTRYRDELPPGGAGVVEPDRSGSVAEAEAPARNG